MALALCLTLLPATALAEGAETVSTLNFCSSPPTVETIYNISGDGTATWTPDSNGVQNKLTLDNVAMTDTSNILKVPANTEIILIGTNKITATEGRAIWAKDGPLKISGAGSLEVTAPSGQSALWSNTSSIDVNISGALTINGNIRAEGGILSLQSNDAIFVTGSMFGKQKITAIAGKSLSITNTSNTAVSAPFCTEVSLAAQDGDLTVSGTGSSDAYGIYGNWQNTALKLHASGNVSVEGTKYSMQGKTLELSGTIPEASTLTAYYTESLTVPAGKTLINNGTIKLDKYSSAVTVSGTLTNNGSIVNSDDAPIQPKVSGNGVITVKAAMDFTGKDTNDTGEGYSWDSASKTLTLTDYKMTEPCNDTAIILPAGAKLVLNGENKFNSKNGALIDAKGALEISGTGSLTGSASGEAALNAQGALTITDCKLDLKNPSPWRTVICTNGNALTIADRADVSLHTAESSGWGIKTGLGGNFTLGSDAKLVIKGGTGILAEGSSVKIAGTLDVSGCVNLGANLLRVALNMEGSSITAATKDKGGIYLYQNAAGTLTGETNIKAFVGNFDVTSPNAPIVKYYTVQKDDTLGLYEEGSTVTFTAETIEGKPFASWTATGVTLTDSTNAKISFTMPGNNVTLTTAYATLVSAVSLNKTELALTAGDTQTLIATITPDEANNKNVFWSSDKPSVATVDKNGNVTAVAAGTANITVKTVDGEKTAVCAVTVTAKSSGGGSTGGSSSGGGGGSSSSSKPSTSTTRPDGTKVQTEIKKDGTKVETTTAKDGSTSKTTTNPNGSSVTETKAADGSTGTGKTDKNGNIIKINLFGHSFGGATTRLFTYILANGAPEEVAAGGDVSEFFKGGKGDYVNSVISIAAPHNGTVSANVGIAVYHGEYIAAMIANVAGMAGSNYLDLKLDQFGLTRAPGEGKASFNPCGILSFALSNDNCLYDLTLHGAQELNAKIGAVENVYYFSYACCGTEPSADGRFQNPTDALGSMAGTGWLIGHIAGITVDGVKLEGDWLRNDGAVPVKSALYPEGEKHEFIVDHKGAYERGVWYVYPVVENANHSTLLGSKTESYIDLYMNQIDIVNAK